MRGGRPRVPRVAWLPSAGAQSTTGAEPVIVDVSAAAPEGGDRPRAPKEPPETVWIDGEWLWRGRRWEWKPGRWEVPPARRRLRDAGHRVPGTRSHRLVPRAAGEPRRPRPAPRPARARPARRIAEPRARSDRPSFVPETCLWASRLTTSKCRMPRGEDMERRLRTIVARLGKHPDPDALSARTPISIVSSGSPPAAPSSSCCRWRTSSGSTCRTRSSTRRARSMRCAPWSRGEDIREQLRPGASIARWRRTSRARWRSRPCSPRSRCSRSSGTTPSAAPASTWRRAPTRPTSRRRCVAS